MSEQKTAADILRDHEKRVKTLETENKSLREQNDDLVYQLGQQREQLSKLSDSVYSIGTMFLEDTYDREYFHPNETGPAVDNDARRKLVIAMQSVVLPNTFKEQYQIDPETTEPVNQSGASGE